MTVEPTYRLADEPEIDRAPLLAVTDDGYQAGWFVLDTRLQAIAAAPRCEHGLIDEHMRPTGEWKGVGLSQDDWCEGAPELHALLKALNEEGDESIESTTLAEFSAERWRAHQKHGENSQEGNDWDSRKSLTILVEEVGEVAKVFNERDLENLTDAQAQQELRKELIQTGAMCLVWIINIDALTEEEE